jgi:hypothetical protein
VITIKQFGEFFLFICYVCNSAARLYIKRQHVGENLIVCSSVCAKYEIVCWGSVW